MAADGIEVYQGAFLIIAMLGIVMFMLGIKTKSHLILNFIIRGISGSILIFFINYWMELRGYSLFVGLNPATVLTSGILGFPGVAMLFIIKFYSLL